MDGRSHAVYICSNHAMIRLEPTPYQEQISQLVQANEVQDALSLVTQLESVPLDEKLAQEVSIKRQMGVWIFCQERRFQNGLDILLDARMSPSQVVGLMGKYLSPGMRSLRAGLLASDPEIVLPSSRFEIRKSLRNS